MGTMEPLTRSSAPELYGLRAEKGKSPKVKLVLLIIVALIGTNKNSCTLQIDMIKNSVSSPVLPHHI